jgi:transcriptional regulator with XRE-family HTH domain
MSRFVTELRSVIKEGRSQVELADAAGLNRGLVSQILNGHAGVTPRTVGRLCAVVNRSAAVGLMAAFLRDVVDEAWTEQLSATPKALHPDITLLRAKIAVSYPPEI